MTTGTVHAQVIAIFALISTVKNSLERLQRATASATSCAKSGAAAMRVGREALAGARVERAEKLLVLARAELSNAIAALHGITAEATGETQVQGDKAKHRWDTPPESWWITTASTIRDHAKGTLEMAESTKDRWNEKNDSEYGRLVARMEKDARAVQERWKESMRETQAVRDIAEAVGDGLPSSHSVARVLPL